MEFLFDTANIADIEKNMAVYPITGVTTNPSIMKAEGDVLFFEHLKKIRALIGPERSLHAQVVAEDAESMAAQGLSILKNADERVFIKVPVTVEGLRAIRILKAAGAGVTATVIYDRIQGLLAIAAGADFIAPYCNRMEAMGRDFSADVAAMRDAIDENGAGTRILAASFHNMGQIDRVFEAGAHAVTVKPSLLNEALSAGYVADAVAKFNADWREVHKDQKVF